MFFKRKKNFRDSLKKLIETPTEKSEAAISVSYTHLTLPTICSV